ncbi:MAG: hypothetical protein RR825_02155 [Ruthenibacterium sp.]
MQKDYRRMGGWLLFFVIAWIFGALVNLISGINVLRGGYPLLGVLVLAAIALRATVIVQIFRRDETARYWLIGEGVLMAIANFYTAYLVAWDAITLVQSVASIGAYALWFCYLTKSQRVAVYLHPDQYLPFVPQYKSSGAQPQYGQPVWQQTPAAPEFCPACGACVTRGTRFCGKCGHSLQ